jgi:hypothetical protein
MNVDQLVNSSLKIQKKWLDNYDQNKLENEIPEVDIGNFFRDNIDDVIEDRLLDTYEEYDVLKNLNKKDFQKIKKSSLLTNEEIEDLKKEIVENYLMHCEDDWIWYSLRECEGKQVLVVFRGESLGQGGILTHLYGIFKSLEDARKSLIKTGGYIDENQNYYF